MIERNLLFNFVRETSDHGPINTWDRQPYVTRVRNGTRSLVQATSNITRNFLVATASRAKGGGQCGQQHKHGLTAAAGAMCGCTLQINNYNSVWPIDHDDGSCYYLDTFNFMAYGGTS